MTGRVWGSSLWPTALEYIPTRLPWFCFHLLCRSGARTSSQDVLEIWMVGLRMILAVSIPTKSTSALCWTVGVACLTTTPTSLCRKTPGWWPSLTPWCVARSRAGALTRTVTSARAPSSSCTQGSVSARATPTPSPRPRCPAPHRPQWMSLPTAPSTWGPCGSLPQTWWRPPRRCPHARMPRLASSACLPCGATRTNASWPFPTSLTLKRMPVRWNWTQTSSPGPGLPAPKTSPAAPAAPAARRTNERRASTRQRNALRRRQKTPREERPSAPAKPTDTYIGEDNYDYPQIKVDDLSSSPTSSPERSASTLEIQPSRASPTSDIESVERKIYKAYKWLRYSYISYSNNKDGESSLVSGEADEGRAGTSHKDNPAPSSSKEACLNAAMAQRTQDLPLEGRSKDAFKEGTSAISPSHGPGPEPSGHPWAEAPEDASQDSNNGGTVEHTFETKKLNGKALSKALSSRAEEPPSPPVPKASGSTLSSGSGNCLRTQSDDSEERSLETICANHNNGRLHPRLPHPHSNGQNFAELEALACSSPGCVDTDHDNLSLTGILLHKDCCGSEMACESPSAGTREDPTDLPDTDSSRAVHGHSGLKRHRIELEDTDSENSSSEKKLKTW